MTQCPLCESAPATETGKRWRLPDLCVACHAILSDQQRERIDRSIQAGGRPIKVDLEILQTIRFLQRRGDPALLPAIRLRLAESGKLTNYQIRYRIETLIRLGFVEYAPKRGRRAAEQDRPTLPPKEPAPERTTLFDRTARAQMIRRANGHAPGVEPKPWLAPRPMTAKRLMRLARRELMSERSVRT